MWGRSTVVLLFAGLLGFAPVVLGQPRPLGQEGEPTAQEQAVDRILQRAQASLATGRLRAARRDFARALRSGSTRALHAYGALLLHERATPSDAARFLTAMESAQANPEFRAGAHAVHAARAHMLRDEPDACLALMLRHAQPQDAAAVDVLRDLAAVYAAGGQLDQAERALSLARRVRPQDPHVIRDLAALLIARGTPEHAVSLLQSRLQLRPDDDAARRQLASALHASGRSAEAIGHLAQLGSSADFRDAARVALEGGDPPRAMNLAQRALSLADADEATSRLVLGLALAAVGRDAEARTALQRVLVLDPGNSEATGALAGLD